MRNASTPYSVIKSALKEAMKCMPSRTNTNRAVRLDEIQIGTMYTIDTDCYTDDDGFYRQSYALVFVCGPYSRYYIFKDSDYLYSVDCAFNNIAWLSDLSNRKIDLTSNAIKKYHLAENEAGGWAELSTLIHLVAGTS